MIVLNLKAKVCMSHLLLKPTFDTFSLIEGEVTTFNRFQVDGRIHKDFFDEAFEKEYSTWGEVRDFFFQVIRGKKTPLNFKFILSLAKDQFDSILLSDSTISIFFNLKYIIPFTINENRIVNSRLYM